MTSDLVGIVFFISVGVLLCLYVWKNGQAKKERQKTIRHLVDKGVQLTPDLLEKIDPVSSSTIDIRRGVLLLGFAVAIVSFGKLSGITSGLSFWLGIAIFPALIGAIYAVFGFIKLR